MQIPESVAYFDFVVDSYLVNVQHQTNSNSKYCECLYHQLIHCIMLVHEYRLVLYIILSNKVTAKTDTGQVDLLKTAIIPINLPDLLRNINQLLV